MEQRFFEKKPAGKVELDFCFGCHAVWFDQYESAALTPGSVLELFKVIHKHQHRPLRPLSDTLGCPACKGKLALTHDVQRSTRISYYRCPVAHGRFTTFFQFLREKQFVRELTRGEIDRLRASVKQVRCSSCGAPVDLARDPQCGYCRAPVSILDPDAVKKTLAELDAQERGRRLGDPQAIVDGLLQGRRAKRDGPVDPDAALEAVLARQGKGRAGTPRKAADNGSILDLVSDAFDFLNSGI